MISDFKYTLRQLAKHPGFTAVAVFSLALGIGATTAIFSVVNDQLLKSLPVKNPDNLVVFEWLPGPKGSQPNWGGTNAGVDDTDLATGKRTSRIFSQHTFEAFRDEHTTLTDVFAVGGLWGINVNIDNQAEIVGFGELVSGNYFGALGVTAIRGRTLLPEDDRPGAEPAAVISYRYWRARFASDPGVIGKTILMNRVPVAIVGITPPDFQGTMRDGGIADITVPLAMAVPLLPGEADLGRPFWWLRLMGRLKPGVTVEQAGASLQSAFQASAREGWSNLNDLPSLRVVPGGKGRTEAERRQEGGIMLLMLGMAGLLLLTACANVANLLLARGGARRREIAVRMALGASRGRIIRQLLIESVSLALACVGLYGLMSYAVLRRTSEIGIRMALGALPGRVLRMILRESLALVCTGVAIGLAAAAAITRLISHMLFGLSATDPVTFAGAALLLTLIAALACLIPARRAAHVDPVVALRAE